MRKNQTRKNGDGKSEWGIYNRNNIYGGNGDILLFADSASVEYLKTLDIYHKLKIMIKAPHQIV